MQIQDLHRETYHFTAQRAEVARDATLRWTALGLGGKLGKARLESRLGGPGLDLRVTGLYALDERQHLDLDTTQEHAAPHATSDLAFKGALRDRARSVWRGIIKVDPGAQKTDAFQENRNLLLSRQRTPTRSRASRSWPTTSAAPMRRPSARSTGAAVLPDGARLRAQGGRADDRDGFFADALARIENLAVRERFAAALALRTG